ncbi:MAG: type II toxin-antitoxin system RelE/ParE family toxin [Candidatus Aureabacteria bacterium]|nr:type II toxin-antitoxin system RelE/ParE family toxin [Candidatus Auribacterota bacterium]
MAEVRWTPQAADDLESITEFVAQDSPHYARLFATDVVEAVERIANFPNLCRIVPERNDPFIRKVILGSYRIVYRLPAELVEILTIHHGARLLDPSKLR